MHKKSAFGQQKSTKNSIHTCPHSPMRHVSEKFWPQGKKTHTPEKKKCRTGLVSLVHQVVYVWETTSPHGTVFSPLDGFAHPQKLGIWFPFYTPKLSQKQFGRELSIDKKTVQHWLDAYASRQWIRQKDTPQPDWTSWILCAAEHATKVLKLWRHVRRANVTPKLRKRQLFWRQSEGKMACWIKQCAVVQHNVECFECFSSCSYFHSKFPCKRVKGAFSAY